jgi:major type 1 subunit fimbrin (pilin)
MKMRWFELSVLRAGLRRLSGALAGVILLAMSGHVWAAATCTGAAQTFTLSMPTSVSVPRDAVVGTLLSGWVSTPQVTNYYNCTVSAPSSSGTDFEPLSMTKSGLTISNGGVTYTVFNTNVPGVGIAVGVRAFINGCGWQAPLDLGGIGAPPPITPPWTGWVCNTVGAVTNGGQGLVMLVKTGPITPGTVSGGILFEAGSATAPAVGSAGTVQAGMRKSFSLTQTAVTVLSCSTPDVTVSMGSYQAATFTGKGSVTKTVGFNVAINNCPAGMTKIQYQFSAPGGVTDATNGVIALASSASTATGVGLKLMDSTSTALKFDTQYQLTGYNTATGGSYTIPLLAAYYQTGASVTPGTANAVLTFTMTYQ